MVEFFTLAGEEACGFVPCVLAFVELWVGQGYGLQQYLLSD